MEKIDYSKKSISSEWKKEKILILQQELFCNMLFSPEEVEFIIRDDIPDRDELIEAFSTEETAKLHNMLNEFRYNVYFTEEGLNNFAESGVISMEKPAITFSPEYRNTIFRRFLDKVSDETYTPFIINPQMFRFPKNVQIVCYSPRKTSIMFYSSNGNLLHAELEETSLANAFYDFASSLSQKGIGYTLSEEESTNKVKQKLTEI